MSSSIIVGAISDVTRATDTSPGSIWIGSFGPLVIPKGNAPEGIVCGSLFRAVFRQGQDGALMVEDLLPMPAICG